MDIAPAYKMELSKDLSRGMWFTISPKYKIRLEGESIYFKDWIEIKNHELGMYIGADIKNPIPIDNQGFKSHAKLPYPA